MRLGAGTTWSNARRELGLVFWTRRWEAEAGGETAGLRERVRERYRLEGMVGEAPELRAVYEVVKQAAHDQNDGAGSRRVRHRGGSGAPRLSSRKDKPFGRWPARRSPDAAGSLFGHERGSFTGAVGRKEGRFELADGGTLFLDEIGEISPTVQVKLLRALQTKEFERVGGTQTLKVDVRVVAATNRDLAAEVKAGKFREDLYYRLNVVAVTLPPLRRRRGDIPALAAHFIDKYSEAYGKQIKGLTPGTLNALLGHDWPGNVRELENAIERAVVLCKTSELTAGDLPSTLRGRGASPARRRRADPRNSPGRDRARGDPAHWSCWAGPPRALPRCSGSACGRFNTA
jgi:two-component system NtrC family response regulator/two-component system response regulator HydG